MQPPYQEGSTKQFAGAVFMLIWGEVVEMFLFGWVWGKQQFFYPQIVV